MFNWLCFSMSEWGLLDEDPTNDDNKIGFGAWKRCGNQEPEPNCQDLDGWRLSTLCSGETLASEQLEVLKYHNFRYKFCDFVNRNRILRCISTIVCSGASFLVFFFNIKLAPAFYGLLMSIVYWICLYGSIVGMTCIIVIRKREKSYSTV